MKIGISGTSGNVGQAVLSALTKHGGEGHQIVAISRTPQEGPGYSGRPGDYDVPETLSSAYDGLDRLLIIPSADLRPGVRSQQAVAAVDAAVAAGVKHVFLLSAVGTREKKDPAMGAAYWLGEQRLLKSSVTAWTILRMNYFSETLAQEAQMALGAGVLTGLAENKVAFVSREDVAACLAGALVTEDHVGAIYNLTGSVSISGNERAQAISKAAGKPVQFAVINEEQLRGGLAQAGLPAFIGDAIVSMQAAQADGAYDIVTGDVERLSGRPPIPLASVLERELAR